MHSQQTHSSPSQLPDLAGLSSQDSQLLAPPPTEPLTQGPPLSHLANTRMPMDGTPYSEAITDVHGPQNMKRTCGSFQDRLADQGLSLPEARRQVKGGGAEPQEAAWRRRPGGQGRSCCCCSSEERRHKNGSGQGCLGRADMISLKLIYREQRWRLPEGQAGVCPKVKLGVSWGLTHSKTRGKGGPRSRERSRPTGDRAQTPQAGETLLEVGMEVGHVLSAGTLCVRMTCGTLAPTGS